MLKKTEIMTVMTVRPPLFLLYKEAGVWHTWHSLLRAPQVLMKIYLSASAMQPGW